MITLITDLVDAFCNFIRHPSSDNFAALHSAMLAYQDLKMNQQNPNGLPWGSYKATVTVQETNTVYRKES